jgi:hypothetical protein
VSEAARTIVISGDVLIEWRFAESKIRDRGGALFDPYNYMELYRKPVGTVSVGDIVRKTVAGLPSFCGNAVRPNVIAPKRNQITEDQYARDSPYWHSYVTCAQFPKVKGKRGRDRDSVWRVEQKLGIDRKRPGATLKNLVPEDKGDASVVVIEQSQHGFDDQRAAWPKSLTEPTVSNSWLLLEWMRPRFNENTPFWTDVSAPKRFGGRIVVVLTAEDLRLSGLQISRSLSWERTVEDLYRALQDRWAASLHGCAHVVVSFGTSGAVLLSADSKDRITAAKLIYDPSAAEGRWAAQFPGMMSGFTRCLTAGTALELISARELGTLDGRGAKAGVLAARHLLENGFQAYGKQERTDTELPSDLRFPTDSIAALFRTVLAAKRKDDPGCVERAFSAAGQLRRMLDVGNVAPEDVKAMLLGALERPDDQAAGPVAAEIDRILEDDRTSFEPADVTERILCLVTPEGGADDALNTIVIQDIPLDKVKTRWCILETVHATADDGTEEAQRIVDLARDVVEFGITVQPTQFPTLQIGKLFLADRAEMENLHAVRELFINYVSSTTASKPLSIAVFGLPGSGKSFAIEELAEELSRDDSQPGDRPHKIVSRTFNLSQFAGPEAISVALHQVRDVGLSGNLPLVFWDEFDTKFDTKLGWLRYFLAPMQDGRFQDGSMVHNIGRAIFVFAGGTSQSMADFIKAAKQKAPDAEATKDGENAKKGDGYKKAAKDAKVPDFLSRLKGFVDVASLDYDDGAEKKIAIDAATALRRAVMFRAKLLDSPATLLQTVQHLENGKRVARDRVNVDRAVTEAFLRVKSFTYGARSMEAIVKMSALSGRDKYDRSSLPPFEQLKLHVGARKFLEYANPKPTP